MLDPPPFWEFKQFFTIFFWSSWKFLSDFKVFQGFLWLLLVILEQWEGAGGCVLTLTPHSMTLGNWDG